MKLVKSVAVIAVAAVLLAGCSRSGRDPVTDPSTPDPLGSLATFPTGPVGGGQPASSTRRSDPTLAADVDYATFKCRVWLGFPEVQRENAAQDFIRALHAYDQSPEFAAQFAHNITTDCKAGPMLKVAEVAAALATLDTEDFPH